MNLLMAAESRDMALEMLKTKNVSRQGFEVKTLAVTLIC